MVQLFCHAVVLSCPKGEPVVLSCPKGKPIQTDAAPHLYRAPLGFAKWLKICTDIG